MVVCDTANVAMGGEVEIIVVVVSVVVGFVVVVVEVTVSDT